MLHQVQTGGDSPRTGTQLTSIGRETSFKTYLCMLSHFFLASKSNVTVGSLFSKVKASGENPPHFLSNTAVSTLFGMHIHVSINIELSFHDEAFIVITCINGIE